MRNFGQIFFISDLHLAADQPHAFELFIDLLNKGREQADAVYILGDLFEAWIGDDDLTEFHQKVIGALQQTVASGLPIYFLHGNRDFLIGKKFLRTTGCEVLAEEDKIDCYGTPVLLMHGDTLCTLDTAYLRSRKRLHNRFVQFLFLSLPLKVRRKIANKLRGQSMQYMQTIDPAIMDVTQNAVESVMQKHAVSYLIHGHTHRPAIHSFLLNDQQATRAVLGAWHGRAKILVWTKKNGPELVTI